MSILDVDLIKVVNALLAGFVASWVFYGLTPHPKASEFERVIQALIFTAFVQLPLALVRWAVMGLPQLSICGWRLSVWGTWTPSVELSWSVVLALLFGFAMAVCANKGQPHKFLNWLKLTKRTAYPSEWANAFHADRENDDCRATLHLKNGRRLFGKVLEYPDQPSVGHFRIVEAEWFLDDQEKQPLECAEALIAGEDVEFVEFEARGMDEARLACGVPQSGADTSTGSDEVNADASELTEREMTLEPALESKRERACPDRL